MVWKLVSRLKQLYLTEKLVIGSRPAITGFVDRKKRKALSNAIRVNVVTSRKAIPEILKSLWYNLFRKNIQAKMAEGGKAISVNVKPPASVRGMKTLDREAFKSTAEVLCFKVAASHINNVMKRLKKDLLRLPGVKPVAELDENDPEKKTHKLFLLNPENVPSVDAFTDEDKEFLNNCGVDSECFRTYPIGLTYDSWRYDEILSAVLPEDSEGIGGFSQIGHIVHLNLRDCNLEYKKIIGEVILDKVPSARTVVNKVGTIDTVFRYFAMELLAGEDDMIATTTEWGVTYKFDFSKVYWNPRLSAEHKRVVDDLETGDVAYDVFAGVGPFAVPAAKKGIGVLANDLNPESYKWLNENSKQKLKGSLLTFNLDGRDFIKDVVKKDLLDRWRGSHVDQKKMETAPLNKIHFFMNLPDLAIEFLDVFPGLFHDVDPEDLQHLKLPRVYCYCFSKSDEPEKDAKERVESVLGCQLDPDHKIRIVRNVAPNKEMLCVLFTLQKDTLFQKRSDVAEPPEKKPKVS